MGSVRSAAGMNGAGPRAVKPARMRKAPTAFTASGCTEGWEGRIRIIGNVRKGIDAFLPVTHPVAEVPPQRGGDGVGAPVQNEHQA